MFSGRYLKHLKLHRPFSTNNLLWLEKSFKSQKEMIIKDFGCCTFFTKPQFQRTNKNKGISVCNYSTQINKVLEERCAKNKSLDAKNEALDTEDEVLYAEVQEEKQENKEDIFEKIAQGDPNVVKQLKILEFEIEFLREQNLRVPTFLRMRDWLELMEQKSMQRRKKFLEFLFKNEKKKENEIGKKEKLAALRSKAFQEMMDEGHLIYKLGHNAMFLRLYEKSLNRLQNERLMGAKMFSQTVVFDCSYDSYMSTINSKNCAQQLKISFTENRIHPAPFNVVFCNTDKSSKLMQHFATIVPNALDDDFPCEMHAESYLDLYPKEKIVYLTPHTRNELESFSHDDIYIIGAFVDKGTGVKASLATAKKHNLRMAKFPLDSYLIWEKGIKSLPLNIVLKILLDRRLYDSWEVALRNVPSRFLTPPKSRRLNFK